MPLGLSLWDTEGDVDRDEEATELIAAAELDIAASESTHCRRRELHDTDGALPTLQHHPEDVACVWTNGREELFGIEAEEREADGSTHSTCPQCDGCVSWVQLTLQAGHTSMGEQARVRVFAGGI
jgi:hypothetical protein